MREGPSTQQQEKEQEVVVEDKGAGRGGWGQEQRRVALGLDEESKTHTELGGISQSSFYFLFGNFHL